MSVDAREGSIMLVIVGFICIITYIVADYAWRRWGKI